MNIFSPGAINTPIIDGQFQSMAKSDGARAMFASMTPLGRIDRAEAMATAILLLASDDSGDSIGIHLVADGGLTQP